MPKISDLLITDELEKKAILKEYEVTEEEFEQKVGILKEWYLKSPHLPYQDVDVHLHKLRVALLGSKLSVEKTKQFIDSYYRLKAVYFNALVGCVPSHEEFKAACKYTTCVTLPRLTPDLARVTIMKLHDPDGEAKRPEIYNLLGNNLIELRLRVDYFLSNTIIVDLEKFSLKTLLKLAAPSYSRMLMEIAETFHLRLTGVHFVNCPPIVERLMTLLKAILPSYIVKKFYVHHDFESLHSHVPKEFLPSDYEGTEKSILELKEQWEDTMREHEYIFQEFQELQIKEHERIIRDDDAIFGMGSEGSFRRLSID